jgi:hypothetical protein
MHGTPSASMHIASTMPTGPPPTMMMGAVRLRAA